MLIYKNTFENIKTRNGHFPIGVSDLNACSFTEMLEKYPCPSGGELASKMTVQTFTQTKETLKEKLI